MISTLEIVLHLCYEWSRTTPTRFANCPIPGESCWSSVLWKTSRAGRTREISLSHEKVRTWLNQPYTTYLNRCSGYNWVFLDRSRFCWDTLGTGNVTKSSTCRPGCQILKIPIGFSIFEICKRRFDPWSAPPRSTHESRDPPCSLLNGSEPSPIQGGASMNETSSGMLHRYLVRLGSGEFGGQFQTLSFLSRSSGHSRAVTILSSGSTCSGSAVEFKWVVRIEWHPHERQDPRYPIRTMNCR